MPFVIFFKTQKRAKVIIITILKCLEPPIVVHCDGWFQYWCKSTKYKHDKLEEFCNLFNLSNLIKSVSCFTKIHSCKIDLILTNNSNSFEKSGITETCLSDFPKLKSTFFKSHFSKLDPKAIYYKSYRNFDESKFTELLINTDFSLQSDNPDENHPFLTRELSKIVENIHRWEWNSLGISTLPLWIKS